MLMPLKFVQNAQSHAHKVAFHSARCGRETYKSTETEEVQINKITLSRDSQKPHTAKRAGQQITQVSSFRDPLY
jgi:hypothetical protein